MKSIFVNLSTRNWHVYGEAHVVRFQLRDSMVGIVTKSDDLDVLRCIITSTSESPSRAGKFQNRRLSLLRVHESPAGKTDDEEFLRLGKKAGKYRSLKFVFAVKGSKPNASGALWCSD